MGSLSRLTDVLSLSSMLGFLTLMSPKAILSLFLAAPARPLAPCPRGPHSVLLETCGQCLMPGSLPGC